MPVVPKPVLPGNAAGLLQDLPRWRAMSEGGPFDQDLHHRFLPTRHQAALKHLLWNLHMKHTIRDSRSNRILTSDSLLELRHMEHWVHESRFRKIKFISH
jgi:hypothetical protein